ncbi:hypothetical protein KIW84_020192 [Lathyrus oleraceus]|uniref:Uncharacterized protein n=1 Tax=Pisum sativum TaxID=3888 RepID=A0A9D5B880_PEA|nr:hypothetical protein KIW84_020192 [Pisum sativum]
MEEMMHLKLPMSKKVYSSVTCAYIKQGQILKAEFTLKLMESSGSSPDVVTYTGTAMLDANDAAGKIIFNCTLGRLDTILYMEPSLPVISSGCLNLF